MERLQELFTHHMILPTYLMWIIFGVVITVLLFLDLFVFHKKDEEPTIGETFRLSAFYIIIALIFGVFIIYEHGMADGMLYYTGYLVEKSLSMDNIFVISLIFSSLNIPTKYQHRVLFWGVLGAIVMRADDWHRRPAGQSISLDSLYLFLLPALYGHQNDFRKERRRSADRNQTLPVHQKKVQRNQTAA